VCSGGPLRLAPGGPGGPLRLAPGGPGGPLRLAPGGPGGPLRLAPGGPGGPLRLAPGGPGGPLRLAPGGPGGPLRLAPGGPGGPLRLAPGGPGGPRRGGGPLRLAPGGPGGALRWAPGGPGGPAACFICFFFHAITCIFDIPGGGSISAGCAASCCCGDVAERSQDVAERNRTLRSAAATLLGLLRQFDPAPAAPTEAPEHGRISHAFVQGRHRVPAHTFAIGCSKVAADKQANTGPAQHQLPRSQQSAAAVSQRSSQQQPQQHAGPRRGRGLTSQQSAVSSRSYEYEHIALKKRVNWFPYVTYDFCTLSIYITSM
jgi:hypothetical protein